MGDGNEERLDFLPNELIPVDSAEPRMSLEGGDVLHALCGALDE
jgi:hypothetical protein